MLTVGITTFKHRFHQYFVPLLNRIKSIAPEIQVIVAINGEHREPLDEIYRSSVLRYLAEKRNVVPIMFPNFRALAKLWNNILIMSTTDFVLVLNDDITITNANVFKNISVALVKNGFRSFRINGWWSHVVLNKWEVDEVGYFDERLLGIGDEDSDFEWRYIDHYQRPFANVEIPGIVNHTDLSHAPTNTRVGAETVHKYSLFNNHFIRYEKYRIDEANGKALGLYEVKLTPVLENLKQYPYELFYRNRKGEL